MDEEERVGFDEKDDDDDNDNDDDDDACWRFKKRLSWDAA